VVLRYYAADGFVLPTKAPAHIAVRDRSFPLELVVSLERRRIFGTIAGGVITTVMWPPSRSVADEDKPKFYADEMIMPAESSANSSQSDSEMQERIRRKLELQKKNSKSLSFTESLANEQQKQKSLKKTKEEMRAAMCEELGRGC